MPSRIEDYAIIADCRSAALVAKDGSIDWLCLPRFDSEACFAALLGSPDHGRWQIAPAGPVRRVQRRYRERTLILETEYETEDGSVTLVDLMPIFGQGTDVARIVVGNRGRVPMRMELIIRFGYGAIVPWVRSMNGGLEAIGGPDVLRLVTPVATHGEGLTTVARFSVSQGERIPFVLTWAPSHLPDPGHVDAEQALAESEAGWREWSARCQVQGPYRPIVERSLITLKALTYEPTGGIVAAATTSLPEEIGGVRNWDYRYCWLRDATFLLLGLMRLGFVDEARSWREWLLRAIAGSASQMQIMYGVDGERRLEEYEIPWLSGYEKSKPVRVGNAASEQFQLDVFGEVLDAMYQTHRSGIETDDAEWRLLVQLMKFLESNWGKPDNGIWEVRGGRRHFTHSKMMAWLAFDRAVKLVETCNCAAGENLERWQKIRDEIHTEVCQRGYNSDKKAFTQFYGTDALDASLLMMPLIGFLPATDERVRNTIEAIQRELLHDGFVLRYRPKEEGVDGLPGREGVFLPCSFWLVDCLYLIGRKKDARELFERLLNVRNDLGLLAEEYDPKSKRQLGNFPQAFSHVALVNAALFLSGVRDKR